MASDWPEIPVADVCNIFLGGTPKRSEPSYWGGPIKWASAKDVANCRTRYLTFTEETITQKGLDNSAAKLLDKNTIVITARGTVGAFCMLGEPMSFNQTCYGLVGLPGTSSHYLYYALKAAIAQIRSISYGTVFDTITMKSFKNLMVPLPSRDQQFTIAHILGSLDNKIELNRRMNQTLEATVRAIFKSWFVDFDPVRVKAEGRPTGLPNDIAALFPDSFDDSELGEVPKGWGVVPLHEIIDVNPPRTLKKGQIAPYLEMKNMPENSARALDWYDREFGSGVKFLNGDTLLARITPCLENGKSAFVDFLEDGQVGWGSTEYIVLRSKENLPLVYSYFLSRTPDFRSHAIVNMTGSSGRQRVPASVFDSYHIVNPDQRVADRFGEISRPIMEKIKKNDEESFTLASIRDILLPKLISGALRVPDAERFVEEAGV